MFCIVKGLEDLGLGKVLDATGNTWTVEYFDSPGSDAREVHRVAKSRISAKKLGINTRIFYYDLANRQWLVGRVLQDDDDAVEVRLAKRTDVSLNHEHVFVRWKRPISDPVVYLANFVTETPQYAQGRSVFLESYVAQRAASWGISALLSSIIDLESHQIDVIRRVLSDPSQRYLLADEVGLGKTIEAGVIIRQAVLDDPKHHRVVVLVPTSLVSQWRTELMQRFGLKDFLDDSVWVLPQEMSNELAHAFRGATLLVIDEAHHLTSGTSVILNQLYDVVRDAAHTVERLLLLSATPALRNERGFHRMLHLLDPVVFNLADEKSFRLKIAHRQALAEAVASLDPQNALQLEWVLDDLVDRLPGDTRLHELATLLKERLVFLPREDDPGLRNAIQLLRAHLSETYRLHRRILRNRRKHVKFLTPQRKDARLVVTQSASLAHLESAVEAWRVSALASTYGTESHSSLKELAEVYWFAICALIEQPPRVAEIFRRRQRGQLLGRGKAKATFEGEQGLIDDIVLAASGPEWLNSRIAALTIAVNAFLDRSTKVVVFCSERTTADSVFSDLRSSIGDCVVRHDGGADEEIEAPWQAFQTNANVKVIVCDSQAEEGLNLQGSHRAVVHFDLPAIPNRVEQRLGRVDRYGSGNPIESAVLVDEGSQYQREWFHLISEGLGVFKHSIASLQYLVEDEFKALGGRLFAEGLEGLSPLTRRLAGSDGAVARELRLIDEQDGLDELSPLAEHETSSLEEVDGDWKRIRDSFLLWVVDTLMFARIPLPNSQSGSAVDPAFKFQYQKPGNSGPATLIPLSGFLYDFIGALDYEAPGASSSRPSSYPYSSYRRAAIGGRVRLLRYGDNFVEAVKSFSEVDDRGRSFAMWRQVFRADGIRAEDVRLYFRFDFMVEANLDDAHSILSASRSHNTDAARSATSRRADSLFSPVVYRVWVDEEGEEPHSDFLAAHLTPPYSRDGVVGRHVDTNLNASRLRSLSDAMPETFASWSDRCSRMRGRALDILRGRPSLAEEKADAIARSRIQDDVRYAQLLSRIQSLSGVEAKQEGLQLQFEKSLNDALREGILDPSVTADVVGVVFLSRRAFPSKQRDSQSPQHV